MESFMNKITHTSTVVIDGKERLVTYSFIVEIDYNGNIKREANNLKIDLIDGCPCTLNSNKYTELLDDLDDHLDELINKITQGDL